MWGYKVSLYAKHLTGPETLRVSFRDRSNGGYVSRVSYQCKSNMDICCVALELGTRWICIAKGSPGRTRSYSIRIGLAIDLHCSCVVSPCTDAVTGEITLDLDCTRVAFALPMLPRICPGLRPPDLLIAICQ